MADPGQLLDTFVRTLESHARLDADDRAAILALPHSRRTVNPSAYLVREGDVPRQCAVLLTGFAYRQKLTGDGARQIVSLHIPGEALDLQHLYLDIADHSIQTLTRVEIVLVPRAALRDLLDARPAIARAVQTSILVEASILREWVLNVGRRAARQRVAHLLCELAVRLERQGLGTIDGYELPMTQEQIGDAVGLTPVHVNRTLKGLEDDGLIVRDKRRVGFPRWDALREAGDFTGRYLHLEPQTSAR